MSNETASSKVKKYKVDKAKGREEAIELKPAGANDSGKPPQQQGGTERQRYRIENILDFNLKFNSIPLERLYKKSYLPATRFLFRKYLFFIIGLTTAWVLYLFLDSDSANRKLIGELYQYDYHDNESTTWTNGSEGPMSSVSYFVISELSDSFVPFLVYLLVMGLSMVAVLVFLTMGDMKESKYRSIETKLKYMESSKQVDCKLAEEDLQKALKEVASKESEFVELTKRLNECYEEVSKSRDVYAKIANPCALFVIAAMFGACFLAFVYPPASLTPVSHFVWFCEAVLMLYLIFPFQMAVPVLFGPLFSLLFEALALKKQMNSLELLTLRPDSDSDSDGWSTSAYSNAEIVYFVVIKVLLHLSIHIIGVYLKLSIQAIKRDTFIKVANMHKDNMKSAGDKEITERMIKSIMPPLFKSIFGRPEDFKNSVNCVFQMRPLFIYPVKELSILFADIVGFTRMSSTKTAEELVYLLNDLYGRFDKLCELTNCEKISTLGDCYYCVSGCLNGELEHARCCVEMGLKMVKEIEQFNRTHGVDVNMRVGVHTGNALCGFIGGKRFRFDVWSSDVTLANKMESSGRPGAVHISQDTYECLRNSPYTCEEADAYLGKQTFFVMRDDEKRTVAEVLKQNQANSQAAAAAASGGSSAAGHESRSETAAAQDETEQRKTDEAQLLSLTLKNGDFFQTEYNAVTMRFNDSEEETKFQSYLMDQHKNSAVGNENAKPDSIKDKNFGKLLWTNPPNLLCVGLFVSLLVNATIASGYLLTFFASGHASCLYAQSGGHQLHLYLLAGLIVLMLALQTLFVVAYLVQCTTLVRPGIRRTFLFDKFTSAASDSRRTSFGAATLNGHPHKQLDRSQKERHVLVRYSVLHCVALVFMVLVPLLIISTSVPIMRQLNDLSLQPANHEVDPSHSICVDQMDIYSPRVLNLFGLYSYFLFIVALIHFSVHIQVSGLVKSLSAFLLALGFVLLGLLGIFDHFSVASDISDSDTIGQLEDAFYGERVPGNQSNAFSHVSIVSFGLYTNLFFSGFVRENAVIVIDALFLCLFIWLINRQSEFIYRLSFKCDQNAQRKIKETEEQKELANWLIEVVLPSHVMNHVKLKKQYSKNYDCVGVLFLSLCNFGEFFEETYEGGRNLLRVLNEISVDFDRLFDEPQYASVEKIKSIGPTFMIASGLQNNTNTRDIQHLYDLVDFALELNEKLEAFNNEAMSVCHFKFQIRMGFHAGPVTAGVIGSDRLLYDIWGDTVNVASRMDSTGASGIMQTTEEMTKILGDKYKFKYRGPVHVKGKDSMVTYYLDPNENTKVGKL